MCLFSVPRAPGCPGEKRPRANPPIPGAYWSALRPGGARGPNSPRTGAGGAGIGRVLCVQIPMSKPATKSPTVIKTIGNCSFMCLLHGCSERSELRCGHPPQCEVSVLEVIANIPVGDCHRHQTQARRNRDHHILAPIRSLVILSPTDDLPREVRGQISLRLSSELVPAGLFSAHHVYSFVSGAAPGTAGTSPR